MDSLTHIVLGAAVAEVVVGKKIGNKALVIGAIAGNIPDFDSFVSIFLNPVDALFFHRGISHSLLVLAMLVPMLALLMRWADKDSRMEYRDWLWVIALPWLSHLIVDLFNTYGTGIFEPFSSIRVSYDSVPIVDILLLEFLIPAVIAISMYNKNRLSRRVIAWVSIFFVVGYFGLSVVIKEKLESTIRKELAVNNTAYSRIQTAPLPLSNLIWMVVVETDSVYNVEQRNIMHKNRSEYKVSLTKNHQLLSSVNFEDVGKIKDFTTKLYTVEQTPDGWIIYDLRYSSLASEYPDAYVFRFEVKRKGNDITINRAHPKRKLNYENTIRYIKRIFN